MVKAREAEAIGTTIKSSPDLNTALLQGSVSLDQAAEIARAEQAAPGCARTLVKEERSSRRSRALPDGGASAPA